MKKVILLGVLSLGLVSGISSQPIVATPDEITPFATEQLSYVRVLDLFYCASPIYGNLSLIARGGSGNYTFTVPGIDTIEISRPDSVGVFLNIPTGNYTFNVSDSLGDSIGGNFFVPDSNYLIANGIICTDIKEASAEISVSLFPNPATTTVTINIDESMVGSPPDDSRASTATVSDITGRKIAAVQLSPPDGRAGIINYQLSIANFANGVYFVTVTTTEGRSATRKLIVSK